MTNGLVFLTAAAGLAATPGAGTLYVLARTLRGGWREGLASVGGTASGGSIHVLIAALGGAALVGGDASRLRLVSLAGGAYLVFVAIRGLSPRASASPEIVSSRRAFSDGLVVALLNPNTALFLLAFLPHFVDPARPALPQLLLLGGITVALNALGHLTWVALGATLGSRTLERPRARLLLQRAGNVLLLVVAGYVLVRAY